MRTTPSNLRSLAFNMVALFPAIAHLYVAMLPRHESDGRMAEADPSNTRATDLAIDRAKSELADILPPKEPLPVLQQLSQMITFALENPDKDQVPLIYRDQVSQNEWNAMSAENKRKYQNAAESTNDRLK